MDSTNVAPRPKRRWRRIIGRSFLGLILLLAVVLACSAAYNYWAFRHYRALYSQPGKLYSVDGYNMHLYCTGSGDPTVVLESGWSDDSLIWGKVQPELSKLTRVCSYDRAGMGWSDPRAGQRDSDSVADQLHDLLTTAGISGPIVLMGHSIAGLHMRAYLSKYRQGIAGVVFVDAATPEQFSRLPHEVEEVQRRMVRQLVWMKRLFMLGVMRLAGQCYAEPPSGMDTYACWYKADNICNPSVIPTIDRESEGFEPSAREVMHTGPFGELPILIFSQDPNAAVPMLSEDVRAEFSAAWFSLQEGLKKLSQRSLRIIAKGSSHYIHIDRADLLNRQVSEFIRQIRGDVPQPSDYGSTKTE